MTAVIYHLSKLLFFGLLSFPLVLSAIETGSWLWQTFTLILSGGGGDDGLWPKWLKNGQFYLWIRLKCSPWSHLSDGTSSFLFFHFQQKSRFKDFFKVLFRVPKSTLPIFLLDHRGDKSTFGKFLMNSVVLSEFETNKNGGTNFFQIHSS